MTPDSDTFAHIIANGLLWYAVLFGVPTVMWIRGRIKWRRYAKWNRQQAANLRVHAGLHSNVIVLPDQRQDVTP